MKVCRFFICYYYSFNEFIEIAGIIGVFANYIAAGYVCKERIIVRINRVYRAFSFVLLWIYSLVVFQQGVIDSIHFLSHTSELLSENFSFHSHANGKLHVHHHDFMETVQKILHHDEREENQNQIPIQQQQTKLHLPEYFFSDLNSISIHLEHSDFAISKLISIALDVLTPPPKC